MVSFLSVSATTPLSWQFSRRPQSPPVHEEIERSRLHTEVLQEPPLTSLPTPNIVSSSIKSKHKDEATCFSTLMGRYLLVFLSLDNIFCKQKEKEQKKPLSIYKLFSHSARPLDSHYQYQIQVSAMDPWLLTASSMPMKENSLGSRQWKRMNQSPHTETLPSNKHQI